MNKSAFRILAAGILTFLCVCAGNAAETSVKIAPGRSVIMASRKNRVAICCVSTGLVAAESRDLPRVQRDLVRRLRIAHDHARLFFQAVANKSEAATMELVDYRRKFGYPLTSWSESYFGDIAGIEGLLGIKYKKDARK